MTKSITISQKESAPALRTPSPPSKQALAGLSLSMLLSSLGTSSASAALPALAQSFHAGFQEVQWIVLSYLLAITVMIVSAGRLGDITGRKFLLLAGLFLYIAASLLCGSAGTLWVLIAGRVAQGIGAAIMMALPMALAGEAMPKESTGRVMGLLGTMSAAGTALGPSLGGVLIAAAGWRAIFLINVPLGILAGFLAHRSLPADRREPGARRPGFDWKGSLILSLTLGFYTLAMTIGRSGFGPLNVALLLAAACGTAVFLRVETTASPPLIPPGAFGAPFLMAGLGMSTLVSAVIMATLVAGPFYLTRVLGLESAGAGLVMTTGPLAAALTGLPSGHQVDRFGAQRMTLAGLAGMAAGTFAFSLPPALPGIAGYMVPLVFITAGYALFQTANNTAVMQALSPDQRGVISGLLNLSRNLGLITGTSVMGAVFSLATGTPGMQTAHAASVAGGMRATFAVAGILVITAIAVATGSRGFAEKHPTASKESPRSGK